MLINHLPLLFGVTLLAGFGILFLVLPNLGIIIGLVLSSVALAVFIVYLFDKLLKEPKNRKPILPLYTTDNEQLSKPMLQELREVVVDPPGNENNVCGGFQPSSWQQHHVQNDQWSSPGSENSDRGTTGYNNIAIGLSAEIEPSVINYYSLAQHD